MVPLLITCLGLGALTFLICVLANPIGRLCRVLDEPDSDLKLHSRTTPLVGGLAVLLPVWALCLVLAVTGEAAIFYGTLAFAIAAFFTLGFLDDRRQLTAKLRLIASIVLCGGLLAAVGDYQVISLKFSFLPAPVPLAAFSAAFTILVLVGLLNAINMADGINGLVIGLSLVWSVVLLNDAPPEILPLLIALSVGLVITFAFNLKGRVFLGDSGAYALSVLIGLFAIYSYNSRSPQLPADTVMIWFLIPVLDCLRLMISRMLGGRSPFSADHDHLHHLLLRLMPHTWTLVCYLLLVGVPSLLAVTFPSLNVYWIVLSLGLYGTICAVGKMRVLAKTPSVRSSEPEWGRRGRVPPRQWLARLFRSPPRTRSSAAQDVDRDAGWKPVESLPGHRHATGPTRPRRA